MEFKLTQKEIQGLLAKALGVEVAKLSTDTKTMTLKVEQDIDSLSFSRGPVADVTSKLASADETAESSVGTTAKSTKNDKGKAVKKEEVIPPEDDEPDDDIDFL